ncbi:PAS domain-containing protein [Aquimonas sp.]|jgi:PAS domain S-box-containing protein|uniref:PAS domain-containing protein n=1 Tax=Aquimonas sp. TaxID=1872588 RepID=UPI0037C0CE70
MGPELRSSLQQQLPAALTGGLAALFVLSTDSLGLWSAAAVVVWALLAGRALMWPQTTIRLRAFLSLQAMAAGLPILGFAALDLVLGLPAPPAGTAEALTFAVNALAVGLGLSRIRSPQLPGFLQLAAGLLLVLSGLAELGAFSVGEGRPRAFSLAFVSVLSASGIILGSSIVRSTLLHDVSLRKGVHLAAALAVAAACADAMLWLLDNAAGSVAPARSPLLSEPSSLLAQALTCAAFVLALAGYRRSAAVFSFAVVVVALLVLAASLLGSPLHGLSELASGLPPLTVALALAVACAGLQASAIRKRRALWRALAWAAGLIVMLIAALALLGHLLDTDQLSPLAVNASLGPVGALGQLALGLLLLLLADSSSEARHPLALLLPASVGGLTVVLGLLGWRALLPEEAVRIERAAQETAQQLGARIEQRLQQFSQIAFAYAEGGSVSRQTLFRLEPSVLAVAEPDGTGWKPRQTGLIDGLQRWQSRLQALSMGLSEHERIEASALLGAERPPWLLVSIAGAEPGQRIRLLVDAGALADSVLGDYSGGYAIELRQGDSLILSRQRADLPTRSGGSEHALKGLGAGWSMTATPLPRTLQVMGSRLPTILLVTGLLLGGTLAAALRLAVLARQRAQQAERIARGMEREVAAREATESALDRSLDEIGLILSSITDGFLFVDRDLRVSFANARAAALLGQAEHLHIGASLLELWPGLASSGRLRELREAMSQREAARFESRMEADQRWLDVRVYPHPEGIALLLQDVSEQHERAQRLAVSESALRGAQRLARVGSWRLDLHSGDWFWSDELFRILGYSPGQLPPSQELLLQHVPSDERQQLQRAFDALLSEGRALQQEHHVLHVKGQRVPALSLAQAEYDPLGNLLAVSGTLQDISAQRQQAAALGAALERSERQAQQLQALNRVSLLASRKLGDPDLVPALLAEIRIALGTRLALLLSAGADSPRFQTGSAGSLPSAIIVSSVEPEGDAAFDGPACDLLRHLGASGPIALGAAELLAETAYSELSPEVLALPLAGLLSVPLQDPKGSVLGYLQVSRPNLGEFQRDDLDVLTQFAQIITITLDWARLIDALQRAQRDLLEQIDELSRNRALLAGAERVAGLGTWQLRFNESRPNGLEISEQVQQILEIHTPRPDLEQTRQLLYPEDRPTIRELFLSLFAGSQSIDAEYRVLCASGTTRWIHIQAELTRDSAGRPQHLLGTMRDVTRARLEQERDREYAEILRGIANAKPLVETLTALIASLENSFSVRVAIAYGFDPRLGVSAFEAPSLPLEFIRKAIELSRVSGVAPSRIAGERGIQVIEEDVLARAEFTSIHAVCSAAGVRSVCATPIFGGSDTLIGVLSVYGTEPGRPQPELMAAIDAGVSLAAIAMKTANARRRIEESQQRLRSLFTLVPDAVFALDPQGQIEDCNAAAAARSGRGRSELIGRNISAIVPHEARAAMRENVELAALGGTQRFERSGISDDGSRADVITTTLPIVVDGATVGVFLIDSDVTAQREAQAALQAALADVQARNQELQDFAFVASHDLQEPLRKVQAFGDRLRLHLADRLDADSADYIQRMRGAAARMQTLINDLLAYSRVSRNAHQPQRVDLSQILQEVLSDLESRIEASHAKVLADPLPVLMADPTQMRQLLQNLIGNALKFTHPERPPVVEVLAEVTPDPRSPGAQVLHLSVQDNGIGFDNRYLDRIFAPFQRLHGRSEYEGSGIGLAIVRKIVERHGGQINADGRPGRGALFMVELPMRTDALSRAAAVCEDSR